MTPDYTFNQTAYEEYSPLLIGPAFSLSYGVGFAGLISTIVHCGLFYGVDIWNRAKNARYEEPDVHLKLMRKYSTSMSDPIFMNYQPRSLIKISVQRKHQNGGSSSSLSSALLLP